MLSHKLAPLALLLAPLTAARALSAESARRQEAPAAAMAILIRNPAAKDGAPPFALADQFGRVQRLVEPTPGIELSRHIGRRVRIRHDTGRTLLATQIDLPLAETNGSQRELRTVSPAQFVPPRRLKRLDDNRTTASARARSHPVVPAQAAEELEPTPAEAFDLDPILDAAESAAGSNGDDNRARESTPAATSEELPYERYTTEELPPVDDYDAYDGYISDTGYGADHADDCPHCRAKATKSAPCPRCSEKQPNKCQSCGQPGGWCGPSCTPASQRGVYGRAEYLLWWFNGMDTPALVTTNNQGVAPILGQPGTSVVYGGDLIDDPRNGMRLSLGGWLDEQRDLGIEADWMIFEQEGDRYFGSDPTGNQIIGRPFYNVAPVFNSVVQPPSDDAQLVSFPGQVGGSLAIASHSELQSFGLRLRTGVCCREVGGSGPCGCESCSGGRGVLGRGPLTRGLLTGGGRPTAISRIDFIAGYRYAGLEEGLVFNENLTDLASTATVGVREAFSTDNDFHGVDVGFIYDWQATRWGLELTSRIAIGGTSQRVAISGTNTVGAGGAGVTTPGGLLAQTSNIGVYERDRFSVLPELSARVLYRVTPRLNLSVAYSLMYWANVVRPGDQIDFSVDGRLASGALTTAGAFSHPRFDIEETSLWAHGLNFGAEYRY